MPLSSILALTLMLIIVIVVIFYQVFWPGISLRRIQQQKFPVEWEPLVRQTLPIYAGLSSAQQLQLHELIKLFLARKNFVGCGGQQIDDEVRVTIAANACLLLLDRNTDCYPQLHSVLVYPSTFVVEHEQRDAIGLVSMNSNPLVGESWSNGKVILAWDDVQRGVTNFRDGHNVVLHEFAHELDHEDGATNGAPILRTRGAYKSWAKVFAAEFAELQLKTVHGHESLLDKYGATNPAEFFAVATETFFERPREMQAHHAELYQELKGFYCVDPAQWVGD